MEKNTIRLFNEVLNQSTSSKRKYACTIFSSAVNLAYNCGIKLTLEDIDKIIDGMVKEGTLNLTAGARGVDGVNATLKYVRDNAKLKGWKIPTLIQLAEDKQVLEYVNNFYSVITGISVNKKFIEDVPDGKIDTKDYALLKGNDLKHYLNMIKSEGDGKEYLLDNYAWNKAGREWLYECNLKEVLQDIDQNIKYLFKS